MSERQRAEHEEMTAAEPNGQEHGKNDAPGWKRELWEWIKSIAIAFVIVMILNHFVFNLSTVKGQSMEPTLVEQEWLFINRAVYVFGEPARGDIVILRDPNRNLKRDEYLVKRVVGIPGDTVEIHDGTLYVNGQTLNEPYIDVQIEDGDMTPVQMADDEYFVMGDNRHRGSSLDSRSFGPVSEELIKGRADFVLWPLSRFGGIE